jgi:hypothetical protein
MMILFMFSRCRRVMISLRPKIARQGTSRVTTIANPLKIAPATK